VLVHYLNNYADLDTEDKFWCLYLVNHKEGQVAEIESELVA